MPDLKGEPKCRFSVTLWASDAAQLDAIRRERASSRAVLIREAVRWWLKQQQQPVRAAS